MSFVQEVQDLIDEGKVMTQTKHTPGPWHRNIKPARKYTTVFADKNKHICYLDAQVMSDGEAEANINLITAAPELLEALSDLVIWDDVNHPEHDAMVQREYEHAIDTEKHTTAGRVKKRIMDKARAAIAKATGGQS